MSTEKKRLSGGKIVFLNIVYVIVGIILFRIVDPFSWYTPDTPEEVAEHFLEAIEEGDFDRAAKFATRDTERELDMLESLGLDPQYRTVQVFSSSEYDDYAIVSYQLEGSDEIHSLHLNREWDGDWKAETTKQALNERNGDSDEMDWLEEEIEEEVESLEVELSEESEWDSEEIVEMKEVEEATEAQFDEADEAIESALEQVEGIGEDTEIDFRDLEKMLKDMQRMVDSLERVNKEVRGQSDK